jgi:ankyrin repeat protein
VRLLLAGGASVNAATRDVSSPGEGLAHDARTALMYAAANGSLATIEVLLAAGADPYQADTKGSRAIDYLLGTGPVQANAKLTAEERGKAIALLF